MKEIYSESAKSVVRVGQKIRSYDFEPRPQIGDRYVEGTVIRIEEGCAVVSVEKDTAFKKEAREEIKTYLGNLLFGEWEGRITVLG